MPQTFTFHPYFPVTAANTANGSEVPKSSVGPTRSKNSKRRAQTRTRSRGTSSQMSSQVLSTKDSNQDDSVPRIGKKDLSEQDRDNFGRAFDLLVLEILTTDMGWESSEFHERAKECLVQACLESLHGSWNF